MRKLSLGDIVDLRAYERERDAFRARIIALKRRRRVGVGPVITLLFENRENLGIADLKRYARTAGLDGTLHDLRQFDPLGHMVGVHGRDAAQHAHAGKADAPSGTTRELAEALGGGRPEQVGRAGGEDARPP